MTVLEPPLPRRQMMFGDSALSTVCSYSEFPLHPAWEKSSFIRAARPKLVPGMSFIRSRTRAFSAGVNWTLCARQAPHKTRIRIRANTPSRRMVRLSYTASVVTSPGHFEGKLVFNFLDVGPRSVGVMGKDGEPLLGDGARVIPLA